MGEEAEAEEKKEHKKKKKRSKKHAREEQGKGVWLLVKGGVLVEVMYMVLVY